MAEPQAKAATDANGVPQGLVVQTPPVVVGRTLYDFGAELVQVLGRLTPLFLLGAMFVYSLVEISRNYQAAQVAESERHAKAVESLNKLLASSFAELEKVRKSQLENLEKITALGATVTDAISKSQDTANKAREQVFESQKIRQEALFELEKAKREQQQLQDSNGQLRQQTWVAESTIDVAQRLVAFLADNRDLARDKRYLSRRYEGVNVGGMTRDRNGNTFFGLYRVPGTEMTQFMQSLSRSYPQFAVRLEDVGGQAAATKGEDRFVREWVSISRDAAFAAAQDQFVEEAYYNRFLAQTKRFFLNADGSVRFEPTKHTEALQAALWSVAVQHGPNTPVIRRAFDGIDLSTAGDDVLIKAIYSERRKTVVYFPNESELSQNLLAVRYRFEEQEALKMLADELKAPKNQGKGP